jgi:xylulokinase
MGATLVAGLALRWLRDDILAMSSANAYEEMTALAATASTGAGGLIFLPYLIGERTPHMNPDARGMFLGLSAEHGRAHLIRAVMEGVTFALYDAFAVLQETGAAPDEVMLAGGGAKSRLWQEIFADVFGMTVSPVKTIEQSAKGAALLAGESIGWFDAASTATKWTERGPAVEPNQERHAVYHELLAIFRNAYRCHVDDFRTLAKLERDGESVTR